MDLRTWPDGPENPKIFKRFFSERACEWHYGVNPVIRLKANHLLWFWSRPKSAPENHAERQAYTHMFEKFSHHVLHIHCQLFPPT